MKTLEKVLAAVILIALVLKFTLTPGGDIMIFWTMSILACIYYPFGFLFFNQIRLRHIFKKVAYKDITTPKIVLGIIAGLGLSIIVIGSLFKLLNLSGANQMLLIGIIVTTIVLLISIVQLVQNSNATSKLILWRAGIIGGLGFFLLLTPALSIVAFQYRDHPDYIEAYSNHMANPQNEELFKKLQLERNKIRFTEEEFKKHEAR